MHRIKQNYLKKIFKQLDLYYYGKYCKVSYSTASKAKEKESAEVKIGRKMGGWQIHSYGDIDELQFTNKCKFPIIRTSSDVVIKVKSTGVNPIDVAMVGGYGSKILNVLRCKGNDIEFPLTFGREFCGTIVQKGMACSEEMKIGDVVWGVVPVHKMGCHAEYVVVPEYCIAKKPNEISETEAGGVLYAGLTAWSALYLSGQLNGITGAFSSCGGGKGKHVLVLGASGGVGSSAVQILKAENVSVVASCSTDAIPIVKGLGANYVIDYTNQEQINDFSTYGPYDIVLDCTGQGHRYAENVPYSYGVYVTLSSPLLRNVDENGIALGMIKNVANLINSNTKSVAGQKGFIKWGYFIPSPWGIEYLSNLIKRRKFLPVVDSVHKFKDTKDAYLKVKNGHLRGKVIIDI